MRPAAPRNEERCPTCRSVVRHVHEYGQDATWCPGCSRYLGTDPRVRGHARDGRPAAGGVVFGAVYVESGPDLDGDAKAAITPNGRWSTAITAWSRSRIAFCAIWARKRTGRSESTTKAHKVRLNADGLGWTSTPRHAAISSGRGGRDRRSKFYEISDNLHDCSYRRNRSGGRCRAARSCAGCRRTRRKPRGRLSSENVRRLLGVVFPREDYVMLVCLLERLIARL